MLQTINPHNMYTHGDLICWDVISSYFRVVCQKAVQSNKMAIVMD